MSRYIDAEELKKHFPKDEDWDCPVNTNSLVCELIDAQPTADVEPVKHGHWIVDKSGYPSIICSECGVKIPMVAGWCMDAHINYCPNCGAKMDEEVSHEQRID